MTITLDEFARRTHDILAADPGRDGREQVRRLLETVLVDEDFVATVFAGQTEERRILYRDEELGFFILSHVLPVRRTKPHDHGTSWAIYGQVEGETTMDEWSVVEPDAAPPRVRRVATYPLQPGKAKLYNEGTIHSPSRTAPARLIRIEGHDPAKSGKVTYEPIAEAA